MRLPCPVGSDLLRQALDRKGAELRVFVADLAGFFVLIRIAPRLDRVKAIKSINGDAGARRRSLEHKDVLPAGYETAARRLYRGLDNRNVLLLVCIQITDADLGHEVSGRTAVYAPGLAAIDDHLWDAMRAASCVLVDGTFWTDDEMIGLGISRKRAREIGHLPQSGPDGMLEWLDRLSSSTRKILIHINNTNPILDQTSAESADLREHGVEMAHDGMEIFL